MVFIQKSSCSLSWPVSGLEDVHRRPEVGSTDVSFILKSDICKLRGMKRYGSSLDRIK